MKVHALVGEEKKEVRFSSWNAVEVSINIESSQCTFLLCCTPAVDRILEQASFPYCKTCDLSCQSI